ncbi:hypothetical protein BJP37_10260 [Moorena bouillonii PNG]|uniref:Uncharacterized protein n=2 Tax=Coleofasciculaceae TaxID=1892251 RepID=A0A1U7N090_9CYAN|nr:hypothetical protein BJP37_10260 [Moorena bouillonii PNG]
MFEQSVVTKCSRDNLKMKKKLAKIVNTALTSVALCIAIASYVYKAEAAPVFLNLSWEGINGLRVELMFRFDQQFVLGF